MIAYGDILHHRILQECGDSNDLSIAHSYRKDLLNFESQCAHVSAFGEIQNLLSESWKALGLQAVQQQIRDAISIKEDELSLSEARKRNSISLALSIVLGTIGAPALAESVMKPLWLLIGLPQFCSGELFDLSITVGTIIMLVSCCFLMVRLFNK